MKYAAGSTQMGMAPAAGARACGRSASLAWLRTGTGLGAKQAITFDAVPDTHRHRWPWGTS